MSTAINTYHDRDSIFVRRCDGCDVVLEGDIRQYLVMDVGTGNQWQLCHDCFKDHSCQHCGEYSDARRIFEWHTPATFFDPPDNGSMAVCPACFDKLSRRKSA